jgi:thiamine pyrophosphokinase
MRWGLISLNGTYSSVLELDQQIKRYVDPRHIEVVLGVDGGCQLLSKLKINATEILGDFDSIVDLEVYKELWPDARVHTYPAEKDFTDAELAFDLVKRHALDKVVVIGGLGGRADHMLSVLFLLAREENFILIDEQNYIEKIDAPYYKEMPEVLVQKRYISLIPLENGFKGVNLRGFKYPLYEANIKFAETVGISNELSEEHATVHITEGSGYLIISSD